MRCPEKSYFKGARKSGEPRGTWGWGCGDPFIRQKAASCDQDGEQRSVIWLSITLKRKPGFLDRVLQQNKTTGRKSVSGAYAVKWLTYNTFIK